MSKIKIISIGSDPEFFIKNEKGFLPSTMFVMGTKEIPEEMGDRFALLKDNLSIEGNIPASYSKEEFINNIEFLKKLINIVIENSPVPDAKIEYTDSAKFKKGYLLSEDGMTFGCSNYEDAWDIKTVQTPVLLNLNTRQIGFHIHIGYEIPEDSKYSKQQLNIAITRAFDALISYQSDKVHYSEIRRKYYGKLGSYRDKPYGVECRSLGGFFTQKKYLGWIYDQVMNIEEFVNENIDEILEAKNVKDVVKINFKNNIKIPE